MTKGNSVSPYSLTAQSIYDWARREYERTGRVPGPYLVSREDYLRLQLTLHEEAMDNLYATRPQPPVTSRGSLLGGLLGGTTGSWETRDYQAPEYVRALEKWEARRDRLTYQYEQTPSTIIFQSPWGPVEIVSNDEELKSTKVIPQDADR